MIKIHKIFFLLLMMTLLVACSHEDESLTSDTALEIKGLVASVDNGMSATRSVDKLSVDVGRTTFASTDRIVFTTIRRTHSPLTPFTYSDIQYAYDGKSWERVEGNLPEKIYWTDGTSAHTFIGYSLPTQGYHWIDNGNDTYAGELGFNKSELDFTSGNDALVKEDLLLYYSENTMAEPDGLSTKINLTHALSNVRVVVNIKNFAASSGAVDTQVGVSDMVLTNQPAKFTWGGDSKNLRVLNLNDASQTTKSVKLWCPEPDGEGDNQSKTFTFYGLTTPQDATFHAINGNDQSLGFSFTVTYPDPMNPQGAPLVKTYQGAFGQTVNFNSGVCTTLNISLNHRDEQMFMDVTYTDWNFVSTPDLGELRKKSTFMDINSAVTTHDMPTATIDDATWLYISGDAVKDIYGNDGTQEHPYRITSASQLLSFAKEVKGGMTFEDKYIRLDADITMQASTAKTSAEDADSKVSPVSWIGIGDAAHAFHGTLLGGDRYINRLCGSPLFLNLGTKAVVEQLHVTTIGSISGGGALAETNAGVIGGCKVIDDVETTGGALVGTNDGIVYACYHTGLSNGNRLIGQDHGNTIGCYQASDITSFDEALVKSLVATLNTSLTTWYASHPNLTEFTFVYSPASYPTVKRNQ